MKKALAGLVIATLFFFVGRNQPAIVVTKSHDAKVAAVDEANSEGTSKAQAEPEAEADQQVTQTVRSLSERVATLQESELFQTLFSNEFKANWREAILAIKQRLFSPLPTEISQLEKESAARLGILKAIDISQTENNPQLKSLLFDYLRSNPPWLLQREAAHTLSQNNDLDEEEQNKLAASLDVKARNTATKRDVELIDRAIAGEE